MTPLPASDAPAAEWLVFADALQQQGDPRGELIALIHAGDVSKRDAHLRQHAQALLGPAAALAESGILKLAWRWCLVDAAEVRGHSLASIAAAVDALLAAPTAGRLRALSLIGVPVDGPPLDLGPIVARLGAADVPASLVELSLIDERAAQSTSLTSRDFEPGPNLVTFGPLDALWAMKGLRVLKLVVADTRQLEPGAISAAELTSLTIQGLRFSGAQYGDAADPSDLALALAAAKLPKLEVFETRLCEEWVVGYLDDEGAYTAHDSAGDEYDEGHSEGADWEGEFGAALRNLVTLPLRRLALTSFASTRSLLELLSSTGLPPTLKELDLSDSALSTNDLAWFQNAPPVSRLERLVVRNTGFTEADAAVLASLGPKVEFSPSTRPSRERFGGDDDEASEPQEAGPPLPKFRYVVGME